MTAVPLVTTQMDLTFVSVTAVTLATDALAEVGSLCVRQQGYRFKPDAGRNVPLFHMKSPVEAPGSSHETIIFLSPDVRLFHL